MNHNCAVCSIEFVGRPDRKYCSRKCKRRSFYERCKYTTFTRNRLRNTYGITLAIYEDLLSKANGVCPLCLKKKDKLCIDHCHSTGKVRGLICNNCNTLIGHIENTEKMERITAYLNGRSS